MRVMNLISRVIKLYIEINKEKYLIKDNIDDIIRFRD